MSGVILGISAFYHDSAAALLVNGSLVGAVQEERFTRKKHDEAFPTQAIAHLLAQHDLSAHDISAVVFYEKPFLKFDRILQMAHDTAPRGYQQFSKAMPDWLGKKLFIKSHIRAALFGNQKSPAPVLFSSHHLSHAASAFYPSPFEEAAILTVDGVGEWATASISVGSGNAIRQLKETHFPHSVGLLYAAFTHYLGFKVNSGEYKVMGLAPYGNLRDAETQFYIACIFDHLIRANDDGSIVLNLDYFRFHYGLTMTEDESWRQLFRLKRRDPEAEITRQHANMALAIQHVTDHLMVAMAKYARLLTGCRKLVMAGGVALNCVSNAAVQQAAIFDDIWVQPAAGDAGGAVGAAFAGWHINFKKPRTTPMADAMQSSYLGPAFTDQQIEVTLIKFNAVYHRFDSPDHLLEETARRLSQGGVVGWFQGRMEFGPRALGNRSILADARDPDAREKVNTAIKFREGFRPFAPAVSAEDAGDYFQLSNETPYMLFTCPVKPVPEAAEVYTSTPFGSLVSLGRTVIPGATHVDATARVQTVSEHTNPKFHALLKAFQRITGCPILINTSFNVRGEPIVCSPAEAYKGFMTTGLDLLVLGNFILYKEQQPSLSDAILKQWRAVGMD